VPISKDHMHVSGSATIEEVLRAYIDREAQWWWFLTTERNGQYFVCTFGSLLPYLTGRTPHIVHNIGDCPVCSGMDPLLWQQTGALVQEALADPTIGTRRVAKLPMAELPVADVEETKLDDFWFRLWVQGKGTSAYGVLEDGVLIGVHFQQTMSPGGGLPEF
jgi:hypothetical protein